MPFRFYGFQAFLTQLDIADLDDFTVFSTGHTVRRVFAKHQPIPVCKDFQTVVFFDIQTFPVCLHSS